MGVYSKYFSLHWSAENISNEKKVDQGSYIIHEDDNFFIHE